MNSSRKSFKQIEPLNEDELDKDLRFLYHNRSDTADQFVDEAVPMIKYHVNEVVARYQERLLDELTEYMRGEIAGIILRVRRETILQPKGAVKSVSKETEGEDGATTDW